METEGYEKILYSVPNVSNNKLAFYVVNDKQGESKSFVIEQNGCKVNVVLVDKKIKEKNKRSVYEKYNYQKRGYGMTFILRKCTNGVRGTVVLRNSIVDDIQLKVEMMNLFCRQTKQKTIEFISKTTGDVIFCLSSPYLEDGGGNVSDKIHYQIENVDNSTVNISFLASSWYKGSHRILPVSIQWQLNVPELTNISTYSKEKSSLIETSLHKVGGEPKENNEMFLFLKLPDLKNNELVESASLVLTQSDVFSADRNIYDLELYHIDSLQSVEKGVLIDKTPLRYYWSTGNTNDSTYTFDITDLVKERYNEKLLDIYLKIKIERRAKGYENYVVLHGATSNILFAPKMKLLLRKKKTLTTNPFHKGDLVYIKKGSHYNTGEAVPEWFCMQRWYVDRVIDDYVVIKFNEFGINYNLSPIHKDCIVLLESAEGEKI